MSAIDKARPSPIATTTDKTATVRSRSSSRRVRTAVAEYMMVGILVLIAVVATVLNHGFWDRQNLENLLSQNAPLALAAIGMTFVIISGGFDLSVGSILALGAVLYASLDGDTNVVLALAASLGVGVVAGALNGLLVAGLGINAFVATLGTASLLTGAASVYTSSEAQLINSDSFYVIGSDSLLGMPIPVWIAAAIFLVGGGVLAKATFGRSVYAIGGNEEAARLCGLRINLVRAATFVIAGGLSALAGVIVASQVGTAQPNFGATLALDAIAVVIIGGTSLFGGEGAIWRTAVGLLILATINNIFQTRALDPSLQLMIKGAIVIGAVGVDARLRARRN